MKEEFVEGFFQNYRIIPMHFHYLKGDIE